MEGDLETVRRVRFDERFAPPAAMVRGRLFTMDVARRRGGDWMVVELGDGQVAMRPRKADVEAF